MRRAEEQRVALASVWLRFWERASIPLSSFCSRGPPGDKIARADLVITGEGRLDESTAMGKGVGELARLSAKWEFRASV